MPMIWEKRVEGDLYQVRTAGETRRLYRNGVLHTELHPKRRVTGSVWDLLLLPGFLVDPGKLRRVLVLGVGGGAVIQQLRHFLAPEEVVGIELSPIHIEAAERFFGVKGKGIRLVRGDAVAWARDYQGPRFDLVIDDLFTEEGRDPVRVVPADPRWCRTLERLVSREGALAMNFPDWAGLKGSCIVKGSAPGFGFIETSPGNDIFFHMSNVDGVRFEDLREGQKVSFDEGQGPKGPRAENVRPL